MNLQEILNRIRRWFSLSQPPPGSCSFRPEFDEHDITTYPSTRDIFTSGYFSAQERRQEYRRRGRSPSGVIDGIYNDTYLEDGASYNDMDRDWDAGA